MLRALVVHEWEVRLPKVGNLARRITIDMVDLHGERIPVREHQIPPWWVLGTRHARDALEESVRIDFSLTVRGIFQEEPNPVELNHPCDAPRQYIPSLSASWQLDTAIKSLPEDGRKYKNGSRRVDEHAGDDLADPRSSPREHRDQSAVALVVRRGNQRHHVLWRDDLVQGRARRLASLARQGIERVVALVCAEEHLEHVAVDLRA